MRKFGVIWPLGILLGLMSIIVWDTQSHRANHLLARDQSPAARGTESRGSLPSSMTEPSTLPEVRMAAFVSKAMQQAMSSPASAPVDILPPAVATTAAQVPPLAPWSITTETTTLTELGRPSGAAPGDGVRHSQNCLDLWDQDTHMTKAEWKAACKRAVRP